MTTNTKQPDGETGELEPHSPLPWSIRDADSLKLGEDVTIDTGGPETPSRWGGVAVVINAARLMSAVTLQQDRHQKAIANARFIVTAVNSHAALTDEVARLREALEDANGLCRSALAIAERQGIQTNWDAFRRQLEDSLRKQHKVMYPEQANDKTHALQPGESEGEGRG